MTTHYLTISGIASRLGISPTTAKKYADEGRLPEPDAVTGDGPKAVRGWLPETIDQWNAERPGRGGRPRKNSSDT